MRHLYPSFFLFILLNQQITCQELSKKYGVISDAEVAFKEYEKDPEAEAVVLFDIGKSEFIKTHSMYNIIFERTTRIKILNEAGIAYANVEIPICKEGAFYEKVYEISAIIYNKEDGEIVRTEFIPDNVYEVKLNENWALKKFVIPNVKVGSIIDYTYKVKSQDVFNLHDWEFQWRIPVVHSKYIAKLIPCFVYTYILQGATSFDEKDIYQEGNSTTTHTYMENIMVNSFTMNDVPAFKSEEYITTINDYIIKLDFQLSKIVGQDRSVVNKLTTWELMKNGLLINENFGKYIKKSKKMSTKVVNEDSLRFKSQNEKFDYILDIVKGNLNWNGQSSYYASTSPSKLLDNKTGNSADINLFTIGLLNAADIETYPVLISTRNHGKIKHDFPFLHFFNYVIILANVDGEAILTDATEVLGLNSRIPTRCINDKGMIVKNDDKVEWVNLACRYLSKITTHFQFEIPTENLMKVEVYKSSTEYDALNYRKSYFDNVENLQRHLNDKGYTVLDSSLIIENAQERNKPYKFSFISEEDVEKIQNKIYRGQ